MRYIKQSGMVIGIFLTSFLGGIVSQLLICPKSLRAESQVIRADRLLVVDNNGQTQGDLTSIADGGGMLNIYGHDGVMRLQLAVYSASGEQGLPMIGLSDNEGNLRLLFRLAGSNESPVLVFKDKEHRDRIVMGLALDDPNEEPFLATIDKDGNKSMVMGSY